MIKRLLISFLPLLLLSEEQDMEKIKKRIEELSNKELGILEEIEKIDYEIILIERELNEIKAKERSLLKLAQKKEEELRKIGVEMEEEKERMRKLFSLIYMFKYIHPFELFLAKPKDVTFMDIFRIIYISNLRKERLTRLESIAKKLSEKEQEYKNAISEHKKSVHLRESRVRVLTMKRAEKREFLKRLENERERYISLLKEMEKASNAISETISKTETLSVSLESVSIKTKRGSLPWPAEGEIVQKFGLVKNKKYNTFVKNNGIVILPKKEEVRAVWRGKVIFADYFEGYGNVIIIDHKDRVYSIYGYLGSILVKKGDFVNPEQVIAMVGSSGLASEGALYFEIREGNEPKNPLLWLFKRQ